MSAWLSLVGLGEDGVEGLGAEARERIASAVLVAGGRRHLGLARPLIRGEALEWPRPLSAALPLLLARRPEPVCVLASGDPFHYGVGSTLARQVPIEEMRVLPAPSSFSLAAARLGWALQETLLLGLNGRPLEAAVPALQPGARLLALSTDRSTPGRLAALLVQRGLPEARLTVLERLGGPRERVRTTAADVYDLDPADLNCVAVEVPDGPEARARAVPRTCGLDDSWFVGEGPMTRREIRAVTLSSLAPRRGELLWDVGLGLGSVAIEWLLADPANRALGLERVPARAAAAAANALALGVPRLRVVEGEAPAALAGLPRPDAIFVGGGVAVPGLLEAAWTALRPGGRLVANAVSLEAEARLLELAGALGGTLTRLGVERAAPLGGLTGWSPARTVTQWRICR